MGHNGLYCCDHLLIELPVVTNELSTTIITLATVDGEEMAIIMFSIIS